MRYACAHHIWLFDSICEQVARWQPPRVTRADVHLAYAVAVTIDVAQLCSPLGWAGLRRNPRRHRDGRRLAPDRFHPLLLPTFVLEFVPSPTCCRRGLDASRSSRAHAAAGSCQTMWRRRST